MSSITAGKKRFVKRMLRNASPTIRIGKSGASPEIMKEIEKQLDAKEFVKAKVLETALGATDAKHIASGVAEEIGAYLVEVRGHTFMLYRRRKR